MREICVYQQIEGHAIPISQDQDWESLCFFLSKQVILLMSIHAEIFGKILMLYLLVPFFLFQQ